MVVITENEEINLLRWIGRRNPAMPRIDELESCKTFEEIDGFLCIQDGIVTTQDKCNYLIEYMGIIDYYLDGGEAEPEFLYSLLRESFCDGDWRLLYGERN